LPNKATLCFVAMSRAFSILLILNSFSNWRWGGKNPGNYMAQGIFSNYWILFLFVVNCEACCVCTSDNYFCQYPSLIVVWLAQTGKFHTKLIKYNHTVT
jgi:hypothetical protein